MLFTHPGLESTLMISITMFIIIKEKKEKEDFNSMLVLFQTMVDMHLMVISLISIYRLQEKFGNQCKAFMIMY